MTEKFKVGDTVRCVDAYTSEGYARQIVKGQEYAVTEVSGVQTLKLHGVPNYWNMDRFELVFSAGVTRVPEPTLIERCDARALKDTNPKDAIASTKVAPGLCSPIAEGFHGAAQFAGMTKYGAWNWRVTGVKASVYIHAIRRHLAAYISGEEHDPIDGTRHLGNIMACCAILLDAEFAGKLTDDRPPSVDIRKAYAEIEANQAFLKEKYKDMEPQHMTIADTQPVKT